MRRILLGLSALALVCSASVASAAPWVPVKTLQFTSDEQTSSGTRTVANANDGRYRWHNGRWWYYMPNNSWVVWSNGRWSPSTGGYSTAYRDGRYYRDDRYYRDGRYNRDGYRDGYRYGYRAPNYRYDYRYGRSPYVSGYRGGVDVYGPRVGGRNGGRRW